MINITNGGDDLGFIVTNRKEEEHPTGADHDSYLGKPIFGYPRGLSECGGRR
jgi:hypothetical protein